MVTRRERSPNALEVLLDGKLVRVLHPGAPPCVFGRGTECQVRIGYYDSGREDRNISRRAGSIRWEGGWTLRNESSSRPFDILVRDLVIPLPPRQADEPSIWAISPPGVDVRIATPLSAHLIGLRLADRRRTANRGDSGDTEDHEGLSTYPLNEPTEYERLVLTAKFLSRHRPGDAVGNAEAAKLVNQVRPDGERQVTDKAVEDVVRRWRDRLDSLGVTGIQGRENINHLGRQLLAYGFIRQEDRARLSG